MMKKLLLLSVLLITQISFSQKQPIGTNVQGLVDWTTAMPFVDMMKVARGWTPSDQQPLSLDSLGNITELGTGQTAVSYSLTGEINWPAGTWVFLYDGSGTFNLRGSASITSSVDGRIEFTVNSAGTLILDITSVDPADYPKNLRMILPGFEATYETEPFHPDFLAEIGQFNTVRFLNWQDINGVTDETTWENRTTPAHLTQHRPANGIALEYIIELANTLDQNPWVEIPHNADDAYIENMAILLRDGLEADRKLYIEYSNEVWNGIFDQYYYARDAGLTLGLSDNEFEAAMRYYSQRSVEIFDIFEDVFGGTDRFVRVTASQAGNTWIANTILDWNSAKDKVDAYAVAPYFGSRRGTAQYAAGTVTWTVDQLLDTLEVDMRNRVDEQQELADLLSEDNISFLTYEGGQHLVGVGAWQSDPTLRDLFIAANRHPRMYDIYTEYMTRWKSISPELMVLYRLSGQPSQYGSWGMREYYNQPLEDAHKLRAVLDYMSEETSISDDFPVEYKTVTAWPNPANTILNVAIDSPSRPTVRFFNLLGQEVEIILNPTGSGLSVDVSDLPNGIYFYKLDSAGGTQQTGKVVVLH